MQIVSLYGPTDLYEAAALKLNLAGIWILTGDADVKNLLQETTDLL